MQILDDGKCFICGKDNPVGFRARFETDSVRRSAKTAVIIPESCQGWQGITHGGIISALLDETCAHACMGAGLKIVTKEIKVRYRAPVPTGTLVTVTAEIVGQRRRLVDVKGRLELDGRIMAEADVIMYQTEMDETAGQ